MFVIAQCIVCGYGKTRYRELEICHLNEVIFFEIVIRK